MDRAEHPGTNEMTRHGLRKRSVRPGDRRGDARTPVMDNYHWETTPVVVRVRADNGSPGRPGGCGRT
jgi:hypothetical protein